MPCLIIVTEERNKESRTVDIGNEAIIGREKSNNVYIDDQRASRQHAKITREPDGSFLLVDMGSRNGIIVNGEKVSRRKLINKDRIVIGRTTLTYSESAAASALADAVQPFAPAETLKLPSDDKTITAPSEGRAGEPAKFTSDALHKAIQEVTAVHSTDKAATSAKKTAPVISGIPKSTQAAKAAASEGQVVNEESSLGKRIIVFLAFLIFFVTILLFAREITKRLLSKAEKSQPTPGILSPEKIRDK